MYICWGLFSGLDIEQNRSILAKKRYFLPFFGENWPFLAKNSVFELLGVLEPPKRGLRGPILLVHGNSGHKLPRIRRGRVFG